MRSAYRSIHPHPDALTNAAHRPRHTTLDQTAKSTDFAVERSAAWDMKVERLLILQANGDATSEGCPVRMRTVVLGAAGTGTSFAITSRLRATWGDGIRIVGLDIFDAKLVATSLLCDAFYMVPYANTDAYYHKLTEVISLEDATSYIPILNDEIFQAHKILSDNQFRAVDIWNSPDFYCLIDKKKADDWLRGLGIRTPHQPKESDLIRDSEKEWFIKPKDGFGSKGATVATGAEIYGKGLFEEHMVQEVCDGPEITVDSFFDAGSQSGLAVCRERLEIKSGVCTKARVFFDGELSAIASKIGSALNQRGTICFQVMRYDGEWVLTDLNLRSGAGTALSCAAGHDVLSAAFACRSGEEFSCHLGDPDFGSSTYVARQYSEFVTART